MRKETFPLHAEGIVRGFLRDLDVVRMAFAQARARDADELRLLVQLLQCWRSRCSPCRRAGRRASGRRSRTAAPCTARGPRRLRGPASCCRPGSSGRLPSPLPIAPRLPMPRYTLNWRPWYSSVLAGGFLAAGHHAAQHDHVGAGRQRLDDVAGVLDAAVRDDRDAVLGRLRAASKTAVIWGTPMPATTRVVQMEPGPMPTFTQSAPASIRALAPLGGGDVARDQLQVGIVLLHQAHRVQNAAVVAVGGVQHHHVHLGLYQRGHAVQHVLGGADGSAAQQAAAVVPGGVRDTAQPSQCP